MELNRAKALIIEFNKTGFTNKKLKELKRGNWSIVSVKLYIRRSTIKNLEP
jgi:hypothetical protein